jgi:hypothetical protein
MEPCGPEFRHAVRVANFLAREIAARCTTWRRPLTPDNLMARVARSAAVLNQQPRFARQPDGGRAGCPGSEPKWSNFSRMVGSTLSKNRRNRTENEGGHMPGSAVPGNSVAQL